MPGGSQEVREAGLGLAGQAPVQSMVHAEKLMDTAAVIRSYDGQPSGPSTHEAAIPDVTGSPVSGTWKFWGGG